MAPHELCSISEECCQIVVTPRHSKSSTLSEHVRGRSYLLTMSTEREQPTADDIRIPKFWDKATHRSLAELGFDAMSVSKTVEVDDPKKFVLARKQVQASLDKQIQNQINEVAASILREEGS